MRAHALALLRVEVVKMRRPSAAAASTYSDEIKDVTRVAPFYVDSIDTVQEVMAYCAAPRTATDSAEAYGMSDLTAGNESCTLSAHSETDQGDVSSGMRLNEGGAYAGEEGECHSLLDAVYDIVVKKGGVDPRGAVMCYNDLHDCATEMLDEAITAWIELGVMHEEGDDLFIGKEHVLK